MSTPGRRRALLALAAARRRNKARMARGLKPIVDGKQVSPSSLKKFDTIDLTDFTRLTDGTVMKRLVVDELIYWIPINKAEKDPDNVEEPADPEDEQAQVDEDNLYDRDGISHRTGGRWLHKNVKKHFGPGPHPSGTPQSVHGRSREGKGPIHTFIPPTIAQQAVARWYETHGGSPPDLDWPSVRQDHDFQMRVAAAYNQLPDYDPTAASAYDAMTLEIEEQFDFLTNEMGVGFEVVDTDPYRNLMEVAADLKTNNRIKVLSTAVTGGHPYWSDEVNDKFRFVHDFFGHVATGRNFDRHGEEAAFIHHAAMFSDAARPAMASETRGQNAYLIAFRDFGPQKFAILPEWAIWTNVHVKKVIPFARNLYPLNITRARETFTADITIAKSFKNQVFGWANVSIRKDGTQIEDHQSHRIDTEDLEDAAYDFVVNSYGSGDMHLSSGKGELIESVVFTKEKMAKMGIPIGTIPEGWWIGFKLDPEHAEMVRSGKRTMFSIEGSARLEPV